MRGAIAVSVVASVVVGGGCAEPVDDPPPLIPIPLLIETTLAHPPLFAAVRADGEPWQQVPFAGSGQTEFAIAGKYELLYVCSDGVRATTQVVQTSTLDGLKRTIGCLATPDAPPTVNVVGQMLQPGRVHLAGQVRESPVAPWAFSFEVPRGVRDLVAEDGEQVLVRRAVEIIEPQTLAAIDLVDAPAFPRAPLRVTGAVLDDEFVTTTLAWATEGGTFIMEFADDDVREVPEELRGAADASAGFATSRSLYTQRIAPLRGSPDVAFPPRLDSILLDDRGARWSELPAANGVSLAVVSETARLLVVATPRWLEGRRSLRTQLDIPGYLDAWRIDPKAARRREMMLDIDTTTSTFGYDVLASP